MNMKIVENGLIPVYEYNGDNTVDARELHEFLKVGKDFSTWIKGRFEKYQFIENTDYILFPNFGENPTGGRPKIDYILTMDTAKELAMVENNDQGRRARKYFIEVEKRYKELASIVANKPHLIGLERELIATQYATEILRVNEGSKILMLETVYKNHDIPTNSLPVYTEEKITKSLTQLLKEHGIALRAQAVNKILKAEGILEQKTRPSRKNPDKTKKFWSLTEKGEKYGKNLISPQVQRETQPHYYEDTFMELMEMIEVV